MDSVSYSNDQEEQQVFRKDDLVHTQKVQNKEGSIPRQCGGQLLFFFNRFKLYCYFCERRGVFQYNLHDFSTSVEAKSCPNNCTVVVSIFKINLEDTMHQHFVINHVKRKLQKYKTMYFIKKKLKSTMWCQVNKLLIFQFLLKNLFYEKNV